MLRTIVRKHSIYVRQASHFLLVKKSIWLIIYIYIYQQIASEHRIPSLFTSNARNQEPFKFSYDSDSLD
jgi:hypothetical protein